MSAREQLSKLMNEWAPKSDLLIKRYCTKHFGIPQLQQIAIFHKSHKKCYIILWGELNLLLIFPVQITQKYLNMFFLASQIALMCLLNLCFGQQAMRSWEPALLSKHFAIVLNVP